MRYRFTRIGDKPVSQVDCEGVIRDCFRFCDNEVKKELNNFIEDRKQQSVTFKFKSGKVILTKVK